MPVKKTRASSTPQAPVQIEPQMAMPAKKGFSLPKQLTSWRPTSYTLFLTVLLIIASFFIGMLVDKVMYLQGGGITTGTQQVAQAGQQQPPPSKPFDGNTGKFPILGNKNAKVTIVEFADFQCPFCEKFYTDTEKNIISDYVNTGKANFAFRNYAFLGQESTWAAEGAFCANDQGKFWEWHNYLYEHQGQENTGAFSKDKLEGFAQAIGLDSQQFNQCLESDKYAKDVTTDTQEGNDFGVTGTPGIFINKTLIVGAQPYASFKTAIDQALAGK